ncbi:MAG: 16S rRNA (cytosine(1402)-N(4))-methyltransferase, partial [Pseudomonadota bacterium]|nr:16S rRNA (cytosine(1402)-N(4))-methyltransferase [Pseudomonadota bacterium]
MNDQHSSNQATQTTESLVPAHVPVLLNETIRALSINPSGVYLDATFGRGGHCRAMLTELSRDGRVIALDRDPQAIAVAKALQAQEPRLEVVQGRFAELGDVIARCGIAGAI